MFSVTSAYLDTLPGEEYFTKYLQSPIVFTLGKKIIKQGRLILFKRAHFYIQITILNSKNVKETFEIPIPFKSEEYKKEGLMFFDYRLNSLCTKNSLLDTKIKNVAIKNTPPSQYYNKILEIQAQIL
jgi:hypothetical protein